jgi:D-cysteine desulfhydrase
MKVPKKLQMANLPTPIQEINFNKCSFLMKRDDYTGTELSGNKIRKLDYLMSEAKRINADYIFTCGGEQSNHCRAAAIAAAILGIKSRLFLWGKDTKLKDGNLFLDEMFGAETEFLNKQDYKNVLQIMTEREKEFTKKKKRVYAFPSGGSSALGIWGYVNFIPELLSQINKRSINSILSAAGSGGTAAGMLIGSAINNWNLKIFAVDVFNNKTEMEEMIVNVAEECLQIYNIDKKINYKRLEVIDGYSTEGYKNIEPKKLKLIKKLAKENGVLLDPAYTGKAFCAFNENFLAGMKNTKTLFLHTGGLYGVFSKRKEYLGI